MRMLKIAVVTALVYVGVVVAFESLIGVLQPSNDATLVITTFGPDGAPHERVVSRLEIADKLYVAANHWPRAWYEQALANPKVVVLVNGAKSDRVAVPVTGSEYDAVNEAHALPLPFRFVTGFPPRELLRLDPAAAPAS